MKKVKGLYLMLVAVLSGTAPASAQDEISTTVGTDVVSQYIWRGQDLGNVSLQPTLGLGYKGLSLTAWGSVGLTEASDTKEFDLTLSYTSGGFTIGVTDYWFDSGLDPENRYFKYDSHGTNHLFEATVGYDFGPLSVAWSTNFAGNDGKNKVGDRAYSSYVELNAPFRLATVGWTATLGAVPFATTSYETTGFAVTNISMKAEKAIKVTDSFSVPIFGQVVANPCSQRAYLVFGFTLQP